MSKGDLSMRMRGIAVALGIAAVIALAGCGKKNEAVKIGHAAPLTGGIAHLGKDNENGVRLAVEEANAKGMTIGGQKVVFEMMSEDDEAKPDKGPIIAQKFVDAKVAGVVGHLNSGVTIPASSVCTTRRASR